MPYYPLSLYIDGEFTQGTSGKSEPVLNPATEEVLGTLPHASPEDLNHAVEASQRGFDTWSTMTALERSKILEQAACNMEAMLDDMAEVITLEMGKPLNESKIEIGFGVDVLRWYAEEGKRAYGRIIPSRVPGTRLLSTKEPIGPCLAFFAWNFPCANAMRKIGGALGAGCSIVIKPAEDTPATALMIAQCFHDAGLPKGVLNVVYGVPAEVSKQLIAHPIPRKISFTGSTPVGILLQKQAADTLKRCTMELGGHAPFIVFEDTDVEAVAKTAALSKFRNAGQVCVSPTRFLVQRSVYDRFVESFVDVAKNIKVGNGMEDGMAMGPLVAERRLPVIQAFVDDAVKKGATLALGGKRLYNKGFFYAPTVLTNVPKDAKIMTEEPFGPIAPIVAFDDLDEVIAEANRPDFGLSAYAFTQNAAHANNIAARLEAGMVGLNSPMISTPESPFGGVNESGYGSEGGIEGLDVFMRIKFITQTGM